MDSPSCIDNEILQDMYLGEENRDATSKIRGYQFQDVVAIYCLLDESVEYLCMEYVEDIFLARKAENGREYIVAQVKYYPQADISEKDIVRDLYYQFLRMQKFNVAARFYLIFHSNSKVSFTENDFKDFLEDFLNNKDIKLKQKIKKENEKICDCSTSSKYESFQKSFFHKQIENNQRDFCVELENRLVTKLDIKNTLLDSNQKKSILFGLAIRKIQSIYQKTETDPEKRKIYRTEFWNDIINSSGISDETIVAYVCSIVMECRTETFEELEETSQEFDQYNIIFSNIGDLLAELAKDKSGRRRLLNTVSQGSEFDQEDCPFEKILCEHDHIKCFVNYLAKIIFDIYNISPELNNENLLDPKYYLIEDDRCLMFRFDPDCGKSIILSRFDQMKRALNKVYPRLKKYKPGKWYLPGGSEICGQKSYNSDVSDIIENTVELDSEFSDISSIKEGNFVVECMSCIKVDQGDWCNRDLCRESKFFTIGCERHEKN